MNQSNQKQSQSTNQSKAWYRYPWVWFMIALPASAVVASLFTVYIATENAPTVIVKQNRFQMDKKEGE
ncbi:FixH family protein [Marinicella rhabdoformis]|uniref:FixH family protein n=1 Tax=Marinicella rhabdoformis TaxID=2580566 RepID=UPI0012AED681|nr:FixH family protein [Marinicella rhabdoformis]